MFWTDLQINIWIQIAKFEYLHLIWQIQITEIEAIFLKKWRNIYVNLNKIKEQKSNLCFEDIDRKLWEKLSIYSFL